MTFMASNLWFIVLCKDFDRTMRDPFSFYSSFGKRYHLFVWGICICTVLFLGYPPTDPTYEEYKSYEAKGLYGEGHFGICWIRGIEGLNWYRWVCVFLPIVVSILYSLLVLERAHEFFAVGMVGSRKLRTTILMRHRTHILTFCIFWTFMGVFYVLSFLLNIDDTIRVLVYAIAMLFRSVVLDPVLFLNYVGIHFHRGGQLMPLSEICRSVFQGQRMATSD